MTTVNVGLNRRLVAIGHQRRKIEHMNVRMHFSCRFEDPDLRRLIQERIALERPGWTLTGYAERKPRKQEATDALLTEGAQKIDELRRERDEAVRVLRGLRNQVSDYGGHGNPGCPDRAEAYLAMQEADQLLLKYPKQ
jgi:hypothetical protein